jgi:hypothetical protein
LFFFSTNYKWYIRAHITTVEYIINQPTEINDEGLYICNVTSTSGFDIGEINVDVLGKIKIRKKDFFYFKIKWVGALPIVRIVPEKSLFALINNAISIDCIVQSTKDYQLIWKRELSSSILIEPSEDRIKIYENGTLKLM